MEPTFFATAADFRAWLERHHDSVSELLLGFHKKGSGRPSITWPEAVDLLPPRRHPLGHQRQEETRERRLTQLIECSAAGRSVPPLARRP